MKKCSEKCPYFEVDRNNSFFGWCKHITRRIFNVAFPSGTYPSTSTNHFCCVDSEKWVENAKE